MGVGYLRKDLTRRREGATVAEKTRRAFVAAVCDRRTLEGK
jgi:hypothetical protein